MIDHAFGDRCKVSYIYALHAGDEVPRYIGSSDKPKMRMDGHIHFWRYPHHQKNERFSNWLSTLDEPPQMKILAVVPNPERWALEGMWIRVMRACGQDLFNVANPLSLKPRRRRGRPGVNRPKRGRVSVPKPRGQGLTPEGRARIAEANRRRWAKWRAEREAAVR